MCGRYSLTRRKAEIMERFAVEEVLCGEEIGPRFNISPSQNVPVIVTVEGKRALDLFKWGLVPFWVKDLKKTKPLINARSETAAEKPFFKKSLQKRRCLIPADGFYEWIARGKQKIPQYIHTTDRELFAFAGIWDEWRSPEGEVLRSCSILTTSANTAVSPVHDRMPVILKPEYEELWLDTSITDTQELMHVLVPYADDQIAMYEVSTAVNSAGKDLAEMINPV